MILLTPSFVPLIISDYSEGYENGETDSGVPPYDDTVYYGPPAEAVFTDPNTGQVYYGETIRNLHQHMHSPFHTRLFRLPKKKLIISAYAHSGLGIVESHITDAMEFATSRELERTSV